VRVVVVGAGAVGSVLGARLALAGHTVTLVARPAHVAAVRANGLRITGTTERTVRLDATAAVPVPLEADAVLLTVKTFDLDRAVAEIARAAPVPLPVLLPQNGLGIGTQVRGAFARAGWTQPELWVVRAVSTVPATLVGPGEVREAGTGSILLPSETGPAAAAVHRFHDLLRDTGLPVAYVPDLVREAWRKAIVNAAVNPVTALHRVPNGALLEGPLRAEALELLGEAVRAAGSSGLDFAEADLVLDFERVVRATAENHSSMRQDLERGRPTEADAILGALVRAGAAHGLELPHLRKALADVDAAARTRPGKRS
jgi:2-dehydropantoate 2-reductase